MRDNDQQRPQGKREPTFTPARLTAAVFSVMVIAAVALSTTGRTADKASFTVDEALAVQGKSALIAERKLGRADKAERHLSDQLWTYDTQSGNVQLYISSEKVRFVCAMASRPARVTVPHDRCARTFDERR